MHSNEFEEKFDAFLEDKSCDTASEALFHVIRSAFIAGWEAAGGAPASPYRLFEVTSGGKLLKRTHRKST